jgi:hypothetical protein
MRWALIAVASLVVAVISHSGPAQAIPGVPSREAVSVTSAPALLSIRYHRHYHHYRHSRYREPPPEAEAMRDAPATAGIGAGAIMPGEWEFAAQLQTQTAQTQPGATLGGGIKNTYKGCIAGDQAVPSALGPGCTIDNAQRDGAQVTWSMTCANRKNAVRSDGVAQYSGETMEGTMISHVPADKGGNGAATDLTQRITGRYLGPCPATAQAAPAPLIPPRTAAAANAAPGNSPRWVEPPAALAEATASGPDPTRPAAPIDRSAPASAEASAAAPAEPSAEVTEGMAAPEQPATRRTWQGKHRRYYAHYRRWPGAAGYGSGGYYRGFGPSPYSSGGN